MLLLCLSVILIGVVLYRAGGSKRTKLRRKPKYGHIDRTGKFTIELRLSDVGLDWCEGGMPTAHGDILVRWWKEDDKIVYQTEVPAGYTLTVKGAPGLQLAPKS